MINPRVWTVGSAIDCDVVVKGLTVSARHCRLSFDGSGYTVEDLESTNGTFVNGERIRGIVNLTSGDAITLGLCVPLPWPPTVAAEPTAVLRIGRAPDNDLVIDEPMVSGHHARVFWEGKPDEAVIEDLGSSNGTAVGSPDRKTARAVFSRSDAVFLGTRAIPGAELLARVTRIAPPTLSLKGACLVVGRDPGCDQVIDRPMISSRHAKLTHSCGQILIEDLGSANGTFVNGQRVQEPVSIKAGDLIGLGSHVLRFAEVLASADVVETLAAEQALAAAPVPLDTAGSATLPPDRMADEIAAILGHPWWLAALLALAPLAAVVLAWASGPARVTAVLFGSAFTAVGFGLANTSIVSRLDAGRRRSATTSHLARVLAIRFAVLGGLCGLQCLLAWGAVTAATGLLRPGLPALGLLFLASAVGLALGLLIVTLAPRPAVAWTLLALSLVPIWLLGGEVVPLARMPSWARLAATTVPSRWAFEGLLLLEADRSSSPASSDVGKPRDLAEAYFPAANIRMGPRADGMALVALLIGLTAAVAFSAAETSRDRPTLSAD